MVDRERLLAKLTYVDAQLAVLRQVAVHPSNHGSDPLAVGGVRYAVQTAIDAVIDICFHVSAKVARHVPQGAHDALDATVVGSGADADQVRRWHAMIGLRNRLVHGYEEVDNVRLVAGLPGGIADFEAFIALGRRWLKDSPVS